MGQGRLDITVARRGTGTVIEQLERKGIEVIEEEVQAPLWGLPPFDQGQRQESKLGQASAQEKGAQEDASKNT
jgi:hypothetical protein